MSGTVTEQDLLQLLQENCIDRVAKFIEEHEALTIERGKALTEQLASSFNKGKHLLNRRLKQDSKEYRE